MTASRVTSFERLQQLPAIFTGAQASMAFGWTSPITSTYVAKWARQGMVRPLGGRSDVFFNLVVQRQYDLEAGLRRVIALATKVGADVLREAGWTTQVMHRPEVAVPANGPRYDLADFQLQSRPVAWFTRTQAGVLDEHYNLRRLKPEWALCDMVWRARDRRHSGAWLLAPDDVDLEAAQASREMPRALAAFGLDAADIGPNGYAQLFDGLQEWRFRLPSTARSVSTGAAAQRR